VKKILAFVFDLARNRMCNEQPVHDDALRANQPDRAGAHFSYWRALVS
jgi:hypothetical protein